VGTPNDEAARGGADPAADPKDAEVEAAVEAVEAVEAAAIDADGPEAAPIEAAAQAAAGTDTAGPHDGKNVFRKGRSDVGSPLRPGGADHRLSP